MKPNIVVDALGLFCPLPVIRTSQALRNLDPGGVVELLSDDPAIEHDMPAFCRSHGHTILHVSTEGGRYRYLIRKSAEAR